MSFFPTSAAQYSPVQLAAAEWLIRRDNGLTTAEQEQLTQWLAADSEHARVFASLELTWQELERLGDFEQTREDAGAHAFKPDLLQTSADTASSRHPALWRFAIAAAVAIAALGWWQFGDNKTSSKSVATDVGELRKLTLSDGSSVQLNTDSAVDTHFSATERRVELLRGEAYFAVAKDAARPFIVKAGGVDVRALGTAFNVCFRTESVEVLVTEGKVRVEPKHGASVAGAGGSHTRTGSQGSQRDLIAGERTIVSLRADATAHSSGQVHMAVPAAEMQRALSWQNRRLEFDSASLAHMAAEFNRYNRHKLVIDDAQLGARKFGGTFEARRYEVLVQLLETNHGVLVERRPDETILRLQR